mmetsp:Transcript_25588/g.48066  ORF Transcript_25588/g.48066 Transcript_25588/m.48066 type:complete len:110 (+) Transcript_25588:2050-2379(+)
MVSTSEWMETVDMPSFLAVRKTRQAISPLREEGRIGAIWKGWTEWSGGTRGLRFFSSSCLNSCLQCLISYNSSPVGDEYLLALKGQDLLRDCREQGYPAGQDGLEAPRS